MSLEKEENEELKTVLQNPAQQERVVDFLVRKRPNGWGRRSIAPYYKESFGKEAKAVLDEMLKTKQDQVYSYEFFKTKFGINKNTLYLRVNQSIMWVVDMMDDKERTYGRLCQMFTVRRKHGVGVILEFIKGSRDSEVSDFKPKPVNPDDDLPKWRKELEKFLEDADVGKTFLKEGLVLNGEEIETMRNALQVPGIMANVTSYSVKVLKIAI